jgi:hypothetical protein
MKHDSTTSQNRKQVKLSPTWFLCDKFGRYASANGFVRNHSEAVSFHTMHDADESARLISQKLGEEVRVVSHML